MFGFFKRFNRNRSFVSKKKVGEEQVFLPALIFFIWFVEQLCPL